MEIQGGINTRNCLKQRLTMSAAQVITKLSKLKKKVIWFLFFLWCFLKEGGEILVK